MRSLLLLLLLPTGSLLKVNGCLGGSVFLNDPEHFKWPCVCNVSDTTERCLTEANGNVKLVKLENGDSKTYCSGSGNIVELEVKVDCKRPITLGPSLGENVSVKCDYPDEFNAVDKYLCKAEDDFNCKEISPKTMSIKVQTDQDYGIYWCGFNDSRHSVLIQKVWIQYVSDVSSQTLEVGENLTFMCNYSGSSGNKDICRGDLQDCQHMLNTSHPQQSRYSMVDQKHIQTLNITIRDLEFKDQGLYWCYSESSDRTFTIHNKFNLTVVSSKDRLLRPVTIVMYFAGVLMVMLVSLLVPWKCLSSRSTTEGHKQEDVHIYEEIQRRPLGLNFSSTAVSSIYVTATHPSTTLDYSTVAFTANADERCVIASPKDPEYKLVRAAPCSPDDVSPTRSSDQEL
ncbi:unnamed protein product [Lota lota]